MTTTTPVRFAALCIVLGALAACGGGRHLVLGFGTHDLGDDLQLRVSTRGMSLIEYELRDTESDRTLVADSLGRNSGRWFFYWDDVDRLWVHSKDAGTIVWVPSRSGRFHRNPVIMGSPFLESMPRGFAKNLPRSAQRSLDVASR